MASVWKILAHVNWRALDDGPSGRLAMALPKIDGDTEDMRARLGMVLLCHLAGPYAWGGKYVHSRVTDGAIVLRGVKSNVLLASVLGVQVESIENMVGTIMKEHGEYCSLHALEGMGPLT